MREEFLYKVISAPHNSEKSVRVADRYRQYVFRVDPRANKKDVKEAVESIFNVKVLGVQVTNRKSKATRNMRTGQRGTKSGYKKAYVKLAEGQQIEFLGEGSQ